MNELETFPVEEFYEVLMSPSGLEEKLDFVLKEIRAKNKQIFFLSTSEMIYQAIVHIHQILNSKLEPPLMKFNALNCARVFFDTCEYPVILFIEVYLLPIIFEIASFKATKKSEEGLSLYFIERGAQSTKQVKRLGLNHVTLAIEFIYATSSIKMYRILENEELEEESHFKKIAKALKMRGVPQVSIFKFYNGSYIEQTRRIFIDKLQTFNPEGFIEFIIELIFGELTEGKHLQLDSKRLIMHGDVYIISPLVNRIQEQLNQMDGNFQGKRKILILFYELVKFGYAEAILLLNSSEFLGAITNEISKVHGDKDMDEGRWIYQKIDDNQKYKKLFYLEFLKCIEVWSHAVPLNEQNQISDAKKFYEFLKFQKKFKFPDNPNIHKYKAELEIYLRQNNERNEKVVELISKRQESSAKSEDKSRYKISQLKDQSNIKYRQKQTTMQFEELQEIVINAMMVLEVIGFQEKRLDKEMKKLQKFKQTWHQNLEMVKKKIIDDDQPYNLDMLISEGEIVYQQIVGLEKIYEEYNSNKINFEQAQQKISAFLNQLQEQNHISEVSVSAKSKHTRLTNRRDLKSKISQKARDRSFSDHSKHSKNSHVSMNKSAKSNFKNKNLTKNRQPINNQQELEKQVQKIYNPINQTFAINYQPVNTSVNSVKKSKEQQILGNLRKKSDQQSEKQKFKNNNVNIEDYGIHKQINRIDSLPTATFIPIKNQNVSFKKETKNNKLISQVSKNSGNQKIQKLQNQKMVQKFQESLQVESLFNKKSQKQDKSSPKTMKKENFSKVLFTSEDENPSNLAYTPKSNIQSMMAHNRDNARKESSQNKKSLIKKILSSEKISFDQEISSESDSQELYSKQPKNLSNKKLSKHLSFNNGNVSAYFNQRTDEYGLTENFKEPVRDSIKSKQTIVNNNQVSDRKEVKNLNKNKLLVFDDVDNTQKANEKNSSSKQFSKIKRSEIQVGGNFDDFQLANCKNEPNESKISKKDKSFFKNSLRDSRMKNNINSSNISQVYQVDISQKIMEHDSFQMIESHYQTREVEDSKLKKSISNKDLNFGEIIEVKKQMIHDRNRVLSPFNHDQPDQAKTRMKKLMEMQNMKLNSSGKANGLMQVLSERTAKKSIQDYLIQKQKNKLIKNLNLRIKRLQNQEMTINTKLSKKDEELRSISYKNLSQNQNMNFRSQNNTHGSIDNSMRDNDSSNTSLYYRLNQQNNEAMKVNALLSGETKYQAGKIVDLTAYDMFLNHLINDSFKKNCLRNKSLILASDEMEIGCMSIKKDKFINFTLFITPKLLSLKNVRFISEPNANLAISIYPDSLYSINAKKQQTVNIKICVENVPFEVPKISIEYELDSGNQAKLKYSNNRSKIQLILPCTFNKLCSFQSINVDDFCGMFNSGDSIDGVKRSQKFKLNSKIFREEKIRQFFPYLVLLKKVENPNTKSRMVYGFETSYNGNVFLVMLKIEDRKYAKIQAKNMTGEGKSDKYVQFFMATFKKLIGQ